MARRVLTDRLGRSASVLAAAALFSALSAAAAHAQSAPAQAAPAPAALAYDAAIGAQLAAQCVTCHQIYVGARARRASGVPEIRGMAPDEFVRHLSEFKSLRRPHLIMTDIAENLSDAEMRALSQYYSSLIVE